MFAHSVEGFGKDPKTEIVHHYVLIGGVAKVKVFRILCNAFTGLKQPRPLFAWAPDIITETMEEKGDVLVEYARCKISSNVY
jgi:hypothetical protein